MNIKTELQELIKRVESLETELKHLREFVQTSEQDIPQPAEAY